MKKTTATASYALLQASMWGFYAILLGYSSNFLYRYGFTDGQISLLLGSATAVSCILQLSLGELISRFAKVTVFRVLLVMGSGMLLGSLMMGYGSAGWVAVSGLALSCGLLQALPAMGNAIGMNAIAHGAPASYDIARGAGSVSYSLLALLTGRLVSNLGTDVISLISMINSAAFIAGILWFHFAGEVPGQEKKAEKQKKSSTPFLKTYPWYALFLLGAVLLLASHNLVCNFMLQIVTAKGGDASHQGVATFISAFTEIPVMFAFGFLLKRMKCDKWLCLSVVFFAVKAVGLYLAETVAGVYAAQATHIFGFAIYSIASVHYAGVAVGKADVVRAQSYLGSTIAMGSLIASFTGGYLCEWFTPQGMILTAAIVGAMGAAIVIPAVRKQMNTARQQTI